MARGDDGAMQTTFRDGITIRPLRDGDTDTIAALFARLGEDSRRHRFGAPKPRLTPLELAELARVDATHHVLVASVGADPRPAGVARLVRDGATAEIACAVADELQRRGVGRILLEELSAVARAAGIRELRAVVAGDNPRIVSLVSRLAGYRGGRWETGDLELVVGL